MAWEKGQSGNPKGKGIGRRDSITNAFLKDLDEEWRENGRQALKDAREQQPALFVKVVASLLPRDVQISAADSFLEALKEINAARRALNAPSGSEIPGPGPAKQIEHTTKH